MTFSVKTTVKEKAICKVSLLTFKECLLEFGNNSLTGILALDRF